MNKSITIMIGFLVCEQVDYDLDRLFSLRTLVRSLIAINVRTKTIKKCEHITLRFLYLPDTLIAINVRTKAIKKCEHITLTILRIVLLGSTQVPYCVCLW